MKILYITSCWPHDNAFGGQLRALNIGRALKKLGDVSLAVVASDSPDSAVVERTGAEFRLESPIRVEMLPNSGLWEKSQWALNPRYLNVHGCVARVDDRERLFKRFDQFDLIWVLNSRTPNILQRWRWPRAVLDIDDIPSTFQRTIWQNGALFKDRLKARVTMGLLQRRERLWKKRFDVVSVCSEPDRVYLGGGKHIHVIPNGFEAPTQIPVRNPVAPPRIGFIGLYSYLPNREGVEWFIRNCWGKIKAQVPEARFRLIGKDTDGTLKPTAPDLDALGFVTDPAAEMNTWSVMITPVHSGAGTRIKIADAFSRKCPVVSTSLGAFGYDVQNGRELLLADSPEDFASACISLIRDPALGSALADRAHEAFLKKWTWDAISPRICAAAEDCLRQSLILNP